MKTPNLFIVGAAKAGTTTIYDHLCEHPDIFMSPIKEPHHFCDDIRRKNFTQPHYKKFDIEINNYLSAKPLRKHHIAYIDHLEHYEALFAGAQDQKYLGECSGGYLYSLTAAQAIFNYNPNAKIIISLREPVDRAYSHWKMNLANGRENANIAFSDCIAREFYKTDKAWGVAHLYVDLGLYYEQIKRYLEIFPRKNILIVFYGDLMVSPQKFMDEIFKFLDVVNIPINEQIKSNQSRKPKFPIVQDFVKRSNVTQFFNEKTIERLKKLATTGDFPVITKPERISIYNKYFKDDFLCLQNLLRVDLPYLKID